MSEKAWLRILNGEPVVFQELRGDDVAVRVGDRDGTMPKSEWQKLTLWPAGVSLDEARTIHRVVREAKTKWGFKRADVRFEEDASGETAVWILFFIGPPFPTTVESTRPLTEAASEVKAALFAEGVNRTPYIDFNEQRENRPVRLGSSR